MMWNICLTICRHQSLLSQLLVILWLHLVVTLSKCSAEKRRLRVCQILILRQVDYTSVGNLYW